MKKPPRNTALNLARAQILSAGLDLDTMIRGIQWLRPNSGTSFGITTIGTMAVHNIGPKLSMLAVQGPSSNYTPEEVALLYDFAQQVNQKYSPDVGWNL